MRIASRAARWFMVLDSVHALTTTEESTMDTDGSGSSPVGDAGELAPEAGDLQALNSRIAHAAIPALDRKFLGAMRRRYHAPVDRNSGLEASEKCSLRRLRSSCR